MSDTSTASTAHAHLLGMRFVSETQDRSGATVTVLVDTAGGYYVCATTTDSYDRPSYALEPAFSRPEAFEPIGLLTPAECAAFERRRDEIQRSAPTMTAEQAEEWTLLSLILMATVPLSVDGAWTVIAVRDGWNETNQTDPEHYQRYARHLEQWRRALLTWYRVRADEAMQHPGFPAYAAEYPPSAQRLRDPESPWFTLRDEIHLFGLELEANRA